MLRWANGLSAQERIMNVLFALATSVILAGSAGMVCAQAPATASGDVLQTPAGSTLYTFDRDTAGKSACNGPCAQNWPAHAAQEKDKASGDFTIVSRDDGSRQWAYKGKPLYTFAKDQKPGDRKGDGMNKVWHVAKP
jgi:predicted lipoprotein with Yx(FWY)xxD motif